MVDEPRFLNVIFITILLLTLPVSTGAAVGAIGQTDDSDLDPDAVVLTVDLQANGTASWSIEHRYRLADDETEEAFGSLQADIEENQSVYVTQFTDRMEPTVQSAQDATERDMALEHVRIDAERRSLPQEYGIVSYEFDWVGFAAVGDTTLSAGDALAGLFLDDETRLVMSWPDAYSLQTVAPTPDEQRDRSVIWRGPRDFGTNEPSLVVASVESLPDDVGAGDSTFFTQAILLLGAGAIAILIAGVAALWWYRSRLGTNESVSVENTDGRDSSSHDLDRGADEPSWELMSNNEKIIRLLEENDGRIKQQQVTQTFDWSDANTSQVVRKLRDDGIVETFRIGRENVIVLTTDEDDETRSI